MVVKINLWDKTLGYIAWDEQRAIGVFEYDSDFLKLSPLNVSPLFMPLSGKIYTFPSLNRETFLGMPGLVADSLPDYFGNAIIDNWLLKNNREISDVTPIEKLCYVGKRGMGALEFEPLYYEETGSIPVDIQSMVELVKKILSHRTSLQTNFVNNDALETIIKIGTSAGGARAKAIIAYNPKTKEVISGQTEVPEGFVHYLIKFDGANKKSLGEPLGYGRIEYAYYKMATDCGIKMNDSSFIEESNRLHFMTKRFDRVGTNKKLHMQTLCAIAHMDYKQPNLYSYERVFETMRSLRLPYQDAEQMFRRMCFNVIAKNCDDHTKNISFLMDKTGKWYLAPAYDVIYSYNPNSFWVSQHQLSVNGKRKNITLPDLLVVGKGINMRNPGFIIENILAVVGNWPKYAKEIDVPKEMTKAISRVLHGELKIFKKR